MVNHLITRSLFKGGQYGDVISMVEEVNQHHHTKTCRKKSTECRFHFKKFPSQRTIIARPPKGESEDISLQIAKKVIASVTRATIPAEIAPIFVALIACSLSIFISSYCLVMNELNIASTCASWHIGIDSKRCCLFCKNFFCFIIQYFFSSQEIKTVASLLIRYIFSH